MGLRIDPSLALGPSGPRYRWEQFSESAPIKSEFAKFERRVNGRPLTDSQFKEWGLQYSQFLSAVYEALHRREYLHHQNIEDPDAAAEFQRFQQIVLATVEPNEQRIRLQLLGSSLSRELIAEYLGPIEIDALLYPESTRPLRTQVERLFHDYQREFADQRVTWLGRKVRIHELIDATKFADEALQERAWLERASCQYRSRDNLHDIWIALLRNREQQAKKIGFSDYLEFRDLELKKVGHASRQDSADLRSTILQLFVPLGQEIMERARQRSTEPIAVLRPWHLDGFRLAVKLRATQSTRTLSPEQVVGLLKDIFSKVDDEFGQFFDRLNSDGLIDIEPRPGKSYSLGDRVELLDASDRAYFFIRWRGDWDWVTDVLANEAGHLMHYKELLKLPVRSQREVPKFFEEFPAFLMQLIVAEHLARGATPLATELEGKQILATKLETLVLLVCHIGRVGEFENWVYHNIEDACDIDACEAKWSELSKLYFPAISWAGFERYSGLSWRSQNHIFCRPFEYSMYQSSLFSLLKWLDLRSLGGMESAREWQKIKDALRMGGSLPGDKLFQMVGFQMPLSPEQAASAMHSLDRLLDELND